MRVNLIFTDEEQVHKVEAEFKENFDSKDYKIEEV